MADRLFNPNLLRNGAKRMQTQNAQGSVRQFSSYTPSTALAPGQVALQLAFRDRISRWSMVVGIEPAKIPEFTFEFGQGFRLVNARLGLGPRTERAEKRCVEVDYVENYTPQPDDVIRAPNAKALIQIVEARIRQDHGIKS